MNHTIAFMGTEGGTSFSGLGVEAALRDIGHNTGNSLFQFALWRQIRNPKFKVWPGYDPQSIREKARLIVIPAANQINPSWDLTAWADFIEACDLPVVCLGLGAQAKIDSPSKIALKPGTNRFLQAVADRCQTIGVRGPYTQEVLANLKIYNTEVIGCPSQTINPKVRGRIIQEKLENILYKKEVKVGHVLGTLEPQARDTEYQLSRIIKDFDNEVFIQTDPRIFSFIYNRYIDEEDREYIKWIGKLIRPDLSEDEFRCNILKKWRFFSDARTWIDDMRRYDIIIGMRIHGVVSAIQAEIPGVCVAFDSRTHELAYTMGYPFIRYDLITENTTLRDLVENVTFSAQRFDHIKQKKYEVIRKILSEAGCEVL